MISPAHLGAIIAAFVPPVTVGSGSFSGQSLARTACASITPDQGITNALTPFTIDGSGFHGHGAITSVDFHRAGPIDFAATGVALQDAGSPQSTLLGLATNFDILAGSTVTNIGASPVIGDVGVSPGNAIVGFPPGTIQNGAQHAGDATAAAAQTSLTTAYNYFQGLAGGVDLSGQDLGGKTLLPGVYKFTSSAQITGTLTLDGGGDPNAQWVFQIASTLTTASGANVALINSARARNVYFAVGSSATLGTTTTFQGNILAQASVTLDTNASIQGRALARVGAVTVDTSGGMTNALDVITGTTAAMSNGVYDVIITFADLTTTTCLGAFTVHA